MLPSHLGRPDLLDTGRDERGQLVCPLPPREGHFDSGCCEAGAIALLTGRGILLMYNGENRRHEQEGDRAYPAGWAGLGQRSWPPITDAGLDHLKSLPQLEVSILPQPMLRIAAWLALSR